MRSALIAALITVASASSAPAHFQYERPLVVASSGQTCVPLPSEIFARAADGLADLRLYRDAVETPYALRTAAPLVAPAAMLPALNLGTRAGETVFDAAMPEGSYSDVVLKVDRKDYIATVIVSGGQTQGEGGATQLGGYTIFDLSAQKLGSSSVLHLPASDFRYLHFRVNGPVRPEDITGLSTGQQTARDLPYVTVAQSSNLSPRSQASTVTFTVSPHVPVDRVSFVPGAEPAEFSRYVRVTVAPAKLTQDQDEDRSTASPRTFSGTLLRLHRVEDGRRIDEERLVIDSSGAVSEAAAIWTVTVENGDDPPLTLTAVRLEMRQRALCFEATAGGEYRLMYGDAALRSPQYDYATLFTPAKDSAAAVLQPERLNPLFQPRADERPFTERHPVLLWGALVLAVVLLGAVALRSGANASKTRQP